MVWTRFTDMHSGGGRTLDWEYLYIEAPEAEAAVIFYNRFGRNPYRVTCTCCGADYWTSESPTLEQAAAFDRGPMPLEDYLSGGSAHVIRAAGILPEERVGVLPEQGYVWTGD